MGACGGTYSGYMGVYRGHGGGMEGTYNGAIVTTGSSIGAMGEDVLWGGHLYGDWGP